MLCSAVLLHPEIVDTNITPYKNNGTFSACLVKLSFMDLHAFKNKKIHFNIMLQNKEFFFFFFKWLGCCSAPSETAMSKHGTEDAGVVQQDMVTQANTVPLSQSVL